jgi:hypothetical protein
MLLKNNFNYAKFYMYEFIILNSNFFVLNINDYEQLNIFDSFFGSLNIFHYKNFSNFYSFDNVFNLFSGNNYFCFVEIFDFYNYLINIYMNISKFDLLGICLNNKFFNLNDKFFNLNNKLFINIFFNVYVVYNFFLLFFYEINNMFLKIKLNKN